MIIPFQQLEPETLTNIIKEFILREGTDYGQEEASMTEKIEQVKQQLINGDAVLVFSELHETVNIMPAQQFNEDTFATDETES